MYQRRRKVGTNEARSSGAELLQKCNSHYPLHYALKFMHCSLNKSFQFCLLRISECSIRVTHCKLTALIEWLTVLLEYINLLFCDVTKGCKNVREN